MHSYQIDNMILAISFCWRLPNLITGTGRTQIIYSAFGYLLFDRSRRVQFTDAPSLHQPPPAKMSPPLLVVQTHEAADRALIKLLSFSTARRRL